MKERSKLPVRISERTKFSSFFSSENSPLAADSQNTVFKRDLDIFLVHAGDLKNNGQFILIILDIYPGHKTGVIADQSVGATKKSLNIC